jgi:hypothetical protein
MYGGELPFTGSVFTLPLVLFGLLLTVAGFVTRRLTHTNA